VYSPEQSQKLAVVLHQPGLHLRAFSCAMHRNASEAPPPKFPPGGAFALRI
jgi:hypothetical protein